MLKICSTSISSMLPTAERVRPCWYNSLSGSRTASPTPHTLLSNSDALTVGPITDEMLRFLQSKPHHMAALMDPMQQGPHYSSTSTSLTPVDQSCSVVARCLTSMATPYVDDLSPQVSASDHGPLASAHVSQAHNSNGAVARRGKSRSPMNSGTANFCSCQVLHSEMANISETFRICPNQTRQGSIPSTSRTVEGLSNKAKSGQATDSSPSSGYQEFELQGHIDSTMGPSTESGMPGVTSHHSRKNQQMVPSL